MKLYAWICTDEDGIEGIPAYDAMTTNGTPTVVPLMGNSFAQIANMRPVAIKVAEKTGRPVLFVASTELETVETVNPDAKKGPTH